ncbi:DUF397 domain-containing protein [Streptomyces sp. NPDC021354]|uniref:DUF397 domain-containing protein n=1 Tax=Streptomyces sp. NPDC021354 TaxID=3154793 RepID=UPI0033DFFD4C
MAEEIIWQKSSFSQGTGECVELAATADGVLMRESDEPQQIIRTTQAKLRAFVQGVKAGDFGYLI